MALLLLISGRNALDPLEPRLKGGFLVSDGLCVPTMDSHADNARYYLILQSNAPGRSILIMGSWLKPPRQPSLFMSRHDKYRALSSPRCIPLVDAPAQRRCRHWDPREG